jgi:hypothetical protein
VSVQSTFTNVAIVRRSIHARHLRASPATSWWRVTVPLKRPYVLVFIEHGTRRVHLAVVTVHPTGRWAVQQARNLAMELGDRTGALRFLIHDRDPVFTTAFDEVFKADGLRVVRTLPQTPRMNAICERVIGTLRRELLNRVLILGGAAPGHGAPQVIWTTTTATDHTKPDTNAPRTSGLVR